MSNKKNSKKKRGASDGAEDSEDLLQNMPLANAILNNDPQAVGSIVASSLPNPDSAHVHGDDVIIAKSVGEAFTGGRSTPVYNLTCTVARSDGKQKERQFVVKIVLMPTDAGATELTTTQAIWQKRESYAVERRFYDCAAPRIRQQNLLAIPKLLYSDRDGSRPWPAVCFLMNDVRQAGFPCHPEFLSVAKAKRALRWIATFHALFWGDQPKRELWDRGGFWTPKNKSGETATKVKIIGVAQQWSQSVRWLENKFPVAISSHTRGLGKRLEAAAGPIAEFLTLQSSKMGTLIHGDFKAANMFFATDEGDSDELGPESVSVLDFQFIGSGLGPEDVAYLLFPDARGHYFDDENELLKIYHEELISQLILHQRGGPSTLSYDSFRLYYELSRVDFTRYLLTKGWVASSEGDVKLVEALEATITRLDGGQAMPGDKDYLQAMASLLGKCSRSRYVGGSPKLMEP